MGGMSTDQTKRLIGLRIRHLRKALGLTQTQIADLLWVEQTAWSNWEVGIRLPDVYAMSRWCDLHGVTLDYIYRGEIRTLPYELAVKLQGNTA